MQKLIPNVWCNRSAEPASQYYEEVFQTTGLPVSTVIEARYPETDLPDFQKEFAGQPVTVNVEIAGYLITLINAGDEFRPSPGVSFMLNFDPRFFDGDADKAKSALKKVWEMFSEEGKELMPLGEYPFCPLYGWVEDKFGVNWQLFFKDPESDPRPFIMPSMMFDGPAQDRAQEAAEFYVSLFAEYGEGAAVGTTFPYSEDTGKAAAGALAYGDFRIGDQWFSIMDNGSGQDHGFGGISLLIQCEDQAEIDRLWDAMSAVPEAEQCGWLKDKFGMAWQVVPANLEELMERPDAFQHMMQMKKLVIADF
ncbi:VOC family protein [Corynebacterium suicordis]|uniref:VOC family protein n=1 Tax=Corynebacterium suicordis DSM 45110 TaxID=1121369 RepID=A0ABR9ZJZ1_9CORY|nr:VOC family protein [Corynebacterium suicordis]MBF4553743.1 VOC family protein [Corynebacterium suicordis DSM 45110]MDR6277280.1 putative 3-demethylubiquinone-9 3-methyltransferase (glyoxalase superfamily) [Corynebacterium suicordis]